MPRLFVQPNFIIHANLLTQHMRRRVAFNIEDAGHSTLINDCAREVQNKLQALQSVDKKIIVGLALGFSSFVLSAVLPINFLVVTGFSYAAYQYGCRQSIYQEYKQSLDNLVNCCIWSLGRVENQAVFDLPAIEEMIRILAPLTSEHQLRDYIDDQIDDRFVQDAEAVRGREVAFDARLNQEQVGLYYGIYGYQQGSATQVFNGLCYLVLVGLDAIKSRVQMLFAHAPEVDEAAPAHPAVL